METDQIQIRVKLYGALRRHRLAGAEGGDRQPFTMQMPVGVIVADLLAKLNIGHGYVSAIALNGQTAALDNQLHDGDEVRIFPPSAGG